MCFLTLDNVAKKRQKTEHVVETILVDNDYCKSRKRQALGHRPQSRSLRNHRYHRKTKQISKGNGGVVAELKDHDYFQAQRSSRQNSGGLWSC